MKVLGILGGMSWESTLVYYRLINQGVSARLGGLHSAKLLLHSVDFAEVAALQREGRWTDAGELLGRAGAGLRAAGAEGLLIATNTMHKVADAVVRGNGLPLLHIADATGEALKAKGRRRAGLLGTRFTMEDRFLRDHLEAQHGIATVVPAEAERAEVHRVIFEELCRGVVAPSSQQAFERIIASLAAAGCDSVILGCTEISLLIDPQATGWPVPLYDSTALHAAAAVHWMLETP
jgi:aspartate racemase